MEIAETSIFTKEITRILTDDEYKKLQNFLIAQPQSGAVIKGSGGLRKVRWKVKGRGKSGGIRTIYYYREELSLLLMIYVYEKSKTEDLTPKQIEMLSKTFIQE
jgi:mRNA-degrading endonuclease RelE of RelBE toxin-antitoxin system